MSGSANPSVLIAGGGLAGLAAAAALGSAGFRVTLFEARAFLGGRATSYPLADSGEVIDNCQHVLLGCCHNLLDFYGRLGVADYIRFYDEFYFLEPGGRCSVMGHGALPFLRMKFLNAGEKIAVVRALLAMRWELHRRRDLDRISMAEWLREKRQPARAVERFWRQVLVSAINEELDRMAAVHGFQVFARGFLGSARDGAMGVPAVPLRELYAPEAYSRCGQVEFRMRTSVERIDASGVLAGNVEHHADYYLSCLPFERMAGVGLEAPAFEHSPITGIHLWFDRAITELPHATLLDRTIQWMFNKGEGKYIQLVVSASRSLTPMPRQDVIALALRELAEFFPAVREAVLEKAHVVKEIRATYSAAPGTEALRPTAGTHHPNLFLAGDWTRSGWPATMEGAVRSGYLAAEAITASAGRPQRFLLA